MEYEGLSDLNLLYDSFRASMKGSAWKEEPQRFEIDFLSEIVALSDEIKSRKYRTAENHLIRIMDSVIVLITKIKKIEG